MQNIQDIMLQSEEQEYEMQYNYVDIGKIQGDDKLSVSRTLMECDDIELFELESI